uniref:Uncharacterized protein n=1 Tax=Salix viminalis TaxID=40686 RepID=A0A6N2NL67_SALVM
MSPGFLTGFTASSTSTSAKFSVSIAFTKDQIYRVINQNRKLDSLNTRNQKAKQGGGYPRNRHQLLLRVAPLRAKGKRLFQSHPEPRKFSLMNSIPLPPGKSSNSFSAVSEESANSLEPMESETDMTSALEFHNWIKISGWPLTVDVCFTSKDCIDKRASASTLALSHCTYGQEEGDSRMILIGSEEEWLICNFGLDNHKPERKRWSTEHVQNFGEGLRLGTQGLNMTRL